MQTHIHPKDYSPLRPPIRKLSSLQCHTNHEFPEHMLPHKYEVPSAGAKCAGVWGGGSQGEKKQSTGRKTKI